MTAPAAPATGHLPGLDGLRAVAVLGVLGYHSGWDWLRGGFLGVSLFFTLSGFLITRLLLDEHRRTGGVDLRRFWSRRARRLLPAALAAIVLAAIVTAAVGTASQRLALPGDAGAALLYVANWRFVAEGAGYASLYQAPSPLQHLWSLAVEEQLYLAVPLLLAGLLALSRRAARLGVVALVGVAVAGTALASSSAALETLYYGSHVRAAELLVGVGLALVISGPDRPAPRSLRALGGPLALVAVAAAWATWRFADPALYRGGLVVHAVLVAVVLWAVTSGPSPLTTLLERRPLVWLGRRSYGAYLYHWPLFLLAEQAGVDAPRTLLLAGAWVGTVALAAASYDALEQPVRTGRWLRQPASLGAALAGAPAAVVLLVFAVSSGAAPVHDPDLAAARLEALARSGADDPRPTATSVAPPTTVMDLRRPAEEQPPATPKVTERPVRLAMFGDSIVAANSLGLAEWAVSHPSFELVPGVVIPGCTLVAEGVRWNGESPMTIEPGCDWERGWPASVAQDRPHIAVIAIGGLDALPWSLPGHEGRVAAGDPPVDERIRREIDGINDLMTGAGVEAVWLTIPDPTKDNGTGPGLLRINQIIREAGRRDGVHVLDMAQMVNRWNGEGLYRSDGVHLEPPDARRLAQELLIPAVLELIGER